jgi:hypothetical protein
VDFWVKHPDSTKCKYKTPWVEKYLVSSRKIKGASLAKVWVSKEKSGGYQPGQPGR